MNKVFILDFVRNGSTARLLVNLEIVQLPVHHGRFGRSASLYRYRSQLFEQLCVRLPLPTGQFSEIKFSACNVRLGWFIGIECDLEPVDLGSIPARASGFNRVMTLSKLCTYTCTLANQAIHPFGVGKLVPAICGVIVLYTC